MAGLTIEEATRRVLLGEELASIASVVRDERLVAMGFDPEDSPKDLFRKESMVFMNQLCRHLGERFAADNRIAASLRAWVARVDEYDAYDALLSNFEFTNREAVVRKGRLLFSDALTGHWTESDYG